jgi:hypothetical protein
LEDSSPKDKRNRGGKRIKYVAGKKIKREKKRFYDQEVFMILKKIWIICDYICSKRLAPFLSEIIPVLERWGGIKLNLKVREKLFRINAATWSSPDKTDSQLRGCVVTNYIWQ